LQDANILTH